MKAEPSKASVENEKPKKKSLKERLEDKKIKVAEKAAKVTVEEAKRKGFTPCSKCKP